MQRMDIRVHSSAPSRKFSLHNTDAHTLDNINDLYKTLGLTGKLLLHLKCVLMYILAKRTHMLKGFISFQEHLESLWRELTWMLSQAVDSHQIVSQEPFTWKLVLPQTWTLSQMNMGKKGQIFSMKITRVPINRPWKTTGLQIFSLMAWTPRLNRSKEEL